MTSFASDFRFALRSLRKSPVLTLVAVATLAIGIGAVTAMYSSLRALVLEPFSYPASDQLVDVWSNNGQPLSGPDFLDLKAEATSFAEFGAYSPRPANLGGERPQSVRSVWSTYGVLRAFGIRPALGRWFEPADDVKGAAPVVILSDNLWKQAFASDPQIVGKQVRVNGGNATVVGVMPASFEFSAPWMRTQTCDLFMPLTLDPKSTDRGSHWMCGIARLKPGVSVSAAEGEIKAIGARLKAQYPNTNSQKPFLVRPLHTDMTRDVKTQVWMLFGAVVLVLLVACANVASMLLARGARRQGEFGVRIALGATRGRMLRLVLTESLVLAAAGAALGILLAYGGVEVIRLIAPTSAARKAAMALNGGALLFAVGVTLLTALLAGLPPAIAALRIAVADLIRQDSRGAVGSAARHRLLRGLIIAQVAVAFVLANGAALFSSSYSKLLQDNASLATEYVLSAELTLRGDRYATKEARARFWEQLAERAAAVPTVTAAGITSKLPLEGGSNSNILVNDEVFDPTAKRTLAEVSAITPGYFSAMGIAIVRGRTLSPADRGNETIGVVVNRAFAETCWPGKDPIGQLIRPNNPTPNYRATVVGVVENTRQWGPETAPRPEMYWSPERAWGNTFYLNVRSTQPAAALTAALRQAVSELDPDLPLSRVRTLQGVVDEATKGYRAITGLINFFMAVTLLLLAVGLYGTLSYNVLQRTREIGVRMALGAGRSQILRLVFKQGSAWIAFGIALGIATALGVATALKSLLYGISSLSPLSLALAAAAVVFSAALACWIPARRAARTDPMIALRAD